MATTCPDELWADFLQRVSAKGKPFDDFGPKQLWKRVCRELGYTDESDIDQIAARCKATKTRRLSRPLSEGFPKLVSQSSNSPPSVPDKSKHAPVTVNKDLEFGLLEDDVHEEAFETHTFVWKEVKEGDFVSYASVNDVAALVKTVVADIARSIDVELSIFSEIAAFGVRPDLWVMYSNNLPIGVIEVKKPDLKGARTEVLEESTVLGEIYDFMLQLPNFYGAYPIFGILTTMEKWRFCWFPGEHKDYGDMDAYAAAEEGPCSLFETPKKRASLPMYASPTKMYPRVHRVEKAVVGENESVEDAPYGRSMNVSRIFHQTEADHVTMRAIASCLLKMIKVQHSLLVSPFDNLKERMLLRFTKGDVDSIHWSRMGKLEGNGKWDVYAQPDTYLYAVEDLGSGSQGRVWLTSTCSGAICVLKFPKCKREEARHLVHQEVSLWNEFYPEFDVVEELWSGRSAIRMPHFASVPDVHRSGLLPSVRSALERFESKGKVHRDVTWANIGQYTSANGETVAVVYDLGHVRDHEEADLGWVSQAIQALSPHSTQHHLEQHQHHSGMYQDLRLGHVSH